MALDRVHAGAPIRCVSAFEPPFRVGHAPAPANYRATLVELTSTERLGEAAEHFMMAAVGLPAEAVYQARRSPSWSSLEAMTPTLVYDADVMGDSRLPTTVLSSVTVPVLALVLYSTASPPWLRSACVAAAQALPDARVAGLEGRFHCASAVAIAGALTSFFVEAAPSVPCTYPRGAQRLYCPRGPSQSKKRSVLRWVLSWVGEHRRIAVLLLFPDLDREPLLCAGRSAARRPSGRCRTAARSG